MNYCISLAWHGGDPFVVLLRCNEVQVALIAAFGSSALLSLHGVVNCFLLKCRKLRREDQETSDWIVSRISLLRTQALGNCSHRNLILSNFYRVSYRQNWRRDFWRLRQNIK